MTKIKGKNVLITGGASGIGKIMGRMALEKWAKSLIIWDVNQDALEATAAELSSHGRVRIYKVDITNSQLVEQTYQQVKQDCGSVDILINCASAVDEDIHRTAVLLYLLVGLFYELTICDVHLINTHAPVRG